MKNLCTNCDYEADWPDSVTDRMFPPTGAVAIVSMEGCPGCGDGNLIAYRALCPSVSVQSEKDQY